MDHLQDVNSSKMVVCRGVVAPQMSDNLTDSNGVVCVCASACGGWLGGRLRDTHLTTMHVRIWKGLARVVTLLVSSRSPDGVPARLLVHDVDNVLVLHVHLQHQ